MEVSWTEMMANILLNIRLPRTWAAMLVGGGLALSGATYQSVFRNPLVSPDLLGVSAGACVGAACAILLKIGALGTQLLALFFGWMAVSVAVFIPRVLKNRRLRILAGLPGDDLRGLPRRSVRHRRRILPSGDLRQPLRHLPGAGEDSHTNREKFVRSVKEN